MEKITFDAAYRTIRNRIRRHDIDSIIEVTLENLRASSGNRLDDLRQIPWQALLAIKWAFQDSMVGTQKSVPANSESMNRIRNEIWNLPDKLKPHDESEQDFRLTMRRLLYAQIEFQRPETMEFFREAALLEYLPEGHRLRRWFLTLTGLEPSEFMDFSFAAYTAVKSGSYDINYQRYFQPLVELYSRQALESYIRLVSLDKNELAGFLRNLPDSRTKVASELFEFPVLSRYPFLRDGITIRCWHPSVFFRGTAGMVHSVMSEMNQQYIQTFADVFEEHCLDLASRQAVEFYDDSFIKRHMPAETKNPDGLLSYDGVNIFLEIKSGLFGQSVLTVGHNETFKHKTRSLQKAVGQAREASEALRSTGTAPEKILDATMEYLLVVTNKELNAGNGLALEAIYPEGTFESFSETTASKLSLENIYVISIDDYERIMEANRREELVLPTFLERCVQDDSNPSTRKFSMSQHLDAQNIPKHHSNKVHEMFESSTARIEMALS